MSEKKSEGPAMNPVGALYLPDLLTTVCAAAAAVCSRGRDDQTTYKEWTDQTAPIIVEVYKEILLRGCRQKELASLARQVFLKLAALIEGFLNPPGEAAEKSPKTE